MQDGGKQWKATVQSESPIFTGSRGVEEKEARETG